MDLDAIATQVVFADLVGASQPAVAKHLQAGTIKPGGTLREWLLAYCDKLRVEASGRQVNETRERRDSAQAMESEVNAQMKLRDLYRQDGLIVDSANVRQMMIDWVSLAKSEISAAYMRIVESIESHHGITVDREQLETDIHAALRAIGDYRFQPSESAGRGGGAVDTTAENPDD